MDDDQWKADGSFRGMSVGRAGGGGKGKARGKGPQFTRVIPKFLQKYHQAPAIQAKFAALPKPGEDEDDGELDEVQQAAIDAYVAEQQTNEAKKGGKQAVTDPEADGGVQKADADADSKPQRKKRKKTQQVAQLGGVPGSDKPKPKRKKIKRAEGPKLSNQKLLSFSMEDEE